MLAPLFPYGPPPGPIVPTSMVGPRFWRAFVPARPGTSPKTFATRRGVLVYARGLTLLDPVTGRARWRRSLSGDFVGLTEGATLIVTLADAVLVLDPVTGRTLGRSARKDPVTRPGEPYVFPSTRAFPWRGGTILEYEDQGEGPVGVAFMNRKGRDAWAGAYLSEVIRGHAGITIGSLRDQPGMTAEADDAPGRTYIARTLCADEEGVWAVRQGFGRAGRLVHIRSLGLEEPGPSVNPTDGLPAWTPEGIVYARGRSLYRFDGRASRRLQTYAHPSVDGADPRSARLTPWGIVQTAQDERSVMVRLDRLL